MSNKIGKSKEIKGGWVETDVIFLCFIFGNKQ